MPKWLILDKIRVKVLLKLWKPYIFYYKCSSWVPSSCPNFELPKYKLNLLFRWKILESKELINGKIWQALCSLFEPDFFPWRWWRSTDKKKIKLKNQLSSRTLCRIDEITRWNLWNICKAIRNHQKYYQLNGK